MDNEELKAENDRLKAEIEFIKEKMDKVPTRQIGDKWYTEGQFQQLIQDARNWGL
jgi:hypothetical protein